MGEILEFRPREILRAEKVEEYQRVVTINGVEEAKPGQWLAYVDGGIQILSGAYLEEEYELVPESVSESRKFVPAGKTVDEVLEFFREYPEEVERVKQLERDGGSRKGILEYEVR